MSEVKTKQTSVPGSKVEIECEVGFGVVASEKENVVKKLTRELDLPGFRKGHVPLAVARTHIGEAAILMEAAEEVVLKEVREVLLKANLPVIGRPEATIIELKPDAPLRFKITVSVLPEIKLPDYKKIASEAKRQAPEVVTEKEVDDALQEMEKNYAVLEKKGKDEPVQKFDDEFVKKLGDFKSLEDFKSKLGSKLEEDKKLKTLEKRRLEIVNAILKETGLEVPEILVEHELEKITAQFKDDVARMNFKLEDYLTHIGKTLEELRVSWKKDATERAKLQLVLNKIAETENIKPDEQAVEQEMKHLLLHYTKADPENARVYVTSILTNEKVFEFLENLNTPKS